MQESVGQELISFRIGEQEFCVDIMAVREIRGWTQATPLPQAPSYVRGVINLRGAVLPIVDLSARLGLGATQPDVRNVIIVVRLGTRLVGLLVDAVSEVLTATSDMVQPTPDVSSDAVRMFIRGILALDGRMISWITLDKILPEQEAEAA
ncbi:Chemotaxis protein CheW [uncultured Defluviicoccus sp.]|uniref:Chemotaxis protein CheW n=1 Tax=metagenome TaxID=256318 RepID=A0A380T7Y2_9ZZZZ|nr:Chemotaxis protein CheW [uncultured Defluviicoccus sp.]